MRVKLTVDAVKQRIRRRLKKVGHALKMNQKRDRLRQHGRFLVFKKEGNSIDHSFDDIEKYARLEGIIAEDEEILSDVDMDDDDDDYEE